MPRMPRGKPAGVRCAHLTEALACELFGSRLRPAVCGDLAPSLEMCGPSRSHAIAWLTALEAATAPDPPPAA
jgi:hypothetical protein